jgi:hypothetical protein
LRYAKFQALVDRCANAERPEELPFGDRHLVLAGDDQWAVKDPVIILGPGGWRMWVCCHPLATEDKRTG